MRKNRIAPFVALCVFMFASPARSAAIGGVELFGKGSLSKNYISADKSTISVSLSGGMAIALFSAVRLEGRYSHISSLQNKLDIAGTSFSGTLSDIKTQTQIFSLGLDIQFLGEKSWFQPFIFVGAGYLETERSYYFLEDGAPEAIYYTEPKQTGISVNAGIGFRARFARSAALEFEIFGYGLDIHKPNPLINMYGTAGLRFYL